MNHNISYYLNFLMIVLLSFLPVIAASDSSDIHKLKLSTNNISNSIWYIKIADNCYSYLKFNDKNKYIDYTCEIYCATNGSYRLSHDTLLLYNKIDSCGEETERSVYLKMILTNKGLCTVAYSKFNKPFKTIKPNQFLTKDSLNIIRNKLNLINSF